MTPFTQHNHSNQFSVIRAVRSTSGYFFKLSCSVYDARFELIEKALNKKGEILSKRRKTRTTFMRKKEFEEETMI